MAMNAIERATVDELGDQFVDMLSDVPIYLRDAAKTAPCKECDGTGKVQLRDQDIQRELAIGLLIAFGARTSHLFPGDPCPYCEASGVDAKEQRAIAARKMAADWHATLSEIFP